MQPHTETAAAARWINASPLNPLTGDSLVVGSAHITKASEEVAQAKKALALELGRVTRDWQRRGPEN